MSEDKNDTLAAPDDAPAKSSTEPTKITVNEEITDSDDHAVRDNEPETTDEEATDNPELEPAPDSETIDVNKSVDELLNVEREDPPPADPHAAQAAAAQSAAAEEAEKKAARHPWIAKLKRGGRYWWSHKKLRYGSLAAFFITIVALSLIPVTRYAILNTVGMRVDATVTVTNLESGLPLENIPVLLGGEEVRTNENGHANFSGRRLGSNDLIVDKLGYAKVERDVVLGLGSNPGVTQEIDATGAQYRFSLKQWLSDDAKVIDAKASSGEDIARVNEQGELLLTISDLSPGAEVRITADGYRDEVIPVEKLEQELTEVDMIPGYRHSFVSNRSGDYDLYNIDVNGENEELLLEASGEEREIPYAVQNEDGSQTAYISSREGEENSAGFVLDGLFIISASDGEERKVTRSEQLQIVGWSGDNLIYVAVVEGVSAGNSQRSKIFSYNLGTTERVELASANYFNDVQLVGKDVYYSVSSFAVPRSQAKLYSINAEGNGSPELVVDTQVWTIGYRNTGTLLFSAEEQKWFEQDLSSGNVKELESAPPASASREYEFGSGGDALRIETRDGKGTLLLTDNEGEERQVLAEPGVSIPIKWINDDYAIYRITTGEESADYIVRIDNGKTQKITDVVGNRSRYFF